MENSKQQLNEALGTELRVLRARHKLSQEQLAIALEPYFGRAPHTSTISAWENGLTSISVELLSAYAGAFEIGIGDIIRSAGLDRAA